jgi:5-methylcytosine-specific restriction endonuclease McrA
MKQSQLKRTTGLKAKTGFKNKTSSFKTIKKSSFKRKKMEDETPQKKLDRLVSIWIRRQYTDVDGITHCCTCGKRDHWENMDAGHFIPRAHMATRYDFRNINAQCKECNQINGGEYEKHAQYIEKTQGVEAVRKLLALKNTVIHSYPYEETIGKMKTILETFYPEDIIQY